MDDAGRKQVDELATQASKQAGPDALRALLRAVVDARLAERPIMSILLDPADVDDAVQSTLIVIAEKIATFEGRASFATWVDRVARNEARMVLRRKGRLSEPVTNDVPVYDRSAQRLSSLIANDDVLQACLDQLSTEHRQALELREVDGYSYDEIAEQLHIPVGTVRSRINRARRQLAELLVTAGVMS